MLTWQAGAPGPFPGCPCPMHCPRGHWRPRPSIMRAHPCPLPIPALHGPLAYHGRLARCPGVPTQRYSPFVATLPTRQQGSCTPPNRFRAYFPHQQQNDFHFVNLTNPLTHFNLTPGSLGRESSSPQSLNAPCIPQSLQTLRPAGLTHSQVPILLNSSTHTPLNWCHPSN